MNSLDQGVALFKAGKFVDAAMPLRMAVAEEPARGVAMLLLSHRFLALHYPPARAPLDQSVVEVARENARKALANEPRNAGAMHALASLSMNEQKWDEAREWYEKLIALEEGDAAAHYGLGYVLLSPWWPDYERALTILGMSKEDPGGHTGPFRDPVRTELRTKHQPALDGGFKHAERALEINPRFDDAMGLISSLLRARTYLHDNVEAFRSDRQSAHEWLMKSLQMRQRNRTP